MRLSRLLPLAATAFAATLAAQSASPPANDILALLQSAAHFTPEEIASLDRGAILSKTLAAGNETEAIVVAAARIPSARPRVTAYVQQLISYVDGDVTQGFGVFSNPPAPHDAAALVLNSADMSDLRGCRPSNCDFRVGAASAQTVASAVDWKAADATDRASALVRERLAAYAADYQKRGDAALVVYTDKSTSVNLGDEWRGIVANSPALAQLAPALQRHLTGYPATALPGAKDSIYWDRQKLTGLKAVIGVTHLTVWDDTTHPDRTFIAQKQIYASHYFYGSLAVTTVVDVPGDPAHATYVIYTNRARGDLLKGGFGGLRRRAAESAIKSSAEDMLNGISHALATGP